MFGLFSADMSSHLQEMTALYTDDVALIFFGKVILQMAALFQHNFTAVQGWYVILISNKRRHPPQLQVNGKKNIVW